MEEAKEEQKKLQAVEEEQKTEKKVKLTDK